jgi:phosphoglycolate phosphatase-like HAD superfamily hydrolase
MSLTSASSRSAFSAVICDLDGTLLDSDEALVAPFIALGVDPARISFGGLPGDECARLGVDLAAYLAAYDVTQAEPFPGVSELVANLGRWAVCSNKHGPVGRAELRRLGWRPESAWFADDFDGPKDLEPVLRELGVGASDALYLGDTDHDRACAQSAGVTFVLAGWNRRCRPVPGDLVVDQPEDLLALLSENGTTSG